MQHLDHVGVAVSNLDAAKALFTRLLGISAHWQETVVPAGVRVAFFKVGTVNIELITPLDNASPLKKSIERRGEGLHHLAFLVQDLEAACHRMQEQGFQPLSTKPKKRSPAQGNILLPP